MKFPWRTSETDPAEKICKHTGCLQDHDKTPVAMFTKANGGEFGLSMQEIGDLIANHDELLGCEVLPPSERRIIEHERNTVFEGALSLRQWFGELLDDRLRPRQPVREPAPTPYAVSEYTAMMRRLSSPSPKR